MPIMRSSILLVEDESEIRELIGLHLRREGYEVTDAANGERAIAQIQQKDFQLIVLDWMLPGASGLELTRWIRSDERSKDIPILFVTAKVAPEHIAAGLDAGADDYLTKPFDTLVLMARVNALLRRRRWVESLGENQPQSSEGLRKLQSGALELYPDSYETYLAGDPLDLTRSEFRLLETLMENQGKVLTRENLIEQIQGDGVNVVGRTVDTHVFGLRKKLGSHSDLIETIRGVGYRVKFLESPQ